jgi:hypothetical protein
MTRPEVRLALAAGGAAAALVAVNALASLGLQAADLTRSGQYTLSPLSVQATRQLDADLVVTGFFRPDQLGARRGVATLLDLYRQQSQHVQVRFVDPDQGAGLAQSLGVTLIDSLALQYGTRGPIVLDAGRQSESDVTAAIMRLEGGRTPVVCWAAGDGERDLQDTDPVSGYSAAAELLRGSGYRAQQVALAQPAIPDTCGVLAVMGPTRSLSDVEQQAVETYLQGGGRLLQAIDPWLAGTLDATGYTVSAGRGLVIEPDPAHAAANDPTVAVVSRFGASPITRNLDGDVVFFPAATPIPEPSDGSTSVALASTSAGAYLIAQQRTDLTPRHFEDSPGPFVLMRSIEHRRSSRLTRIVLVGTSALAENGAMPPAASSANPNLLLASLDWLTGQDALLAVPPKPPPAVALPLAGGAPDWHVLIALPLPLLAVLAAGLLVLVRRRGRPA